MSADNGPNIGHFGPEELAKEVRWASEIKAARERFRLAVDRLITLPTHAERMEAIEKWAAKYGRDAARTLLNYVGWTINGKPKTESGR